MQTWCDEMHDTMQICEEMRRNKQRGGTAVGVEWMANGRAVSKKEVRLHMCVFAELWESVPQMRRSASHSAFRNH